MAKYEDNPEELPWYLLATDNILSIIAAFKSDIAAVITLCLYATKKSSVSYVNYSMLMYQTHKLVSITEEMKRFSIFFGRFTEFGNDIFNYLDCHEVQYISRKQACQTNSNSIELNNCVFSWGQQMFQLQPLQLSIKHGEFITVVGRVGSGKSSLLSAICGEMPLSSGSGCVYGSIGYVSQKPWIMNATFRGNVLFGNTYDEQKYSQIIAACALVSDIEQLPAKDATEIGPKGINLSGGQKARLALARAIYNDADIYILDDILSAVDAQVERHLIEHVLAGNGIIRSKTRILVTHAEHVIPLSSRTLRLDNGKVSISNQDAIEFHSIIADGTNSSTDASADNASNNENSKDTDDASSTSEDGKFIIAPELDVPQFNRGMIWKYVKFCGVGLVALILAIEIGRAHLEFHSNLKQKDLFANDKSSIEPKALQRYLLMDLLFKLINNQLSHISALEKHTLEKKDCPVDITDYVGELINGHEVVRIHNKVTVFVAQLQNALAQDEKYKARSPESFDIYTFLEEKVYNMIELGGILYAKWLQTNEMQVVHPGDVKVWIDMCIKGIENMRTFIDDCRLEIYLPRLAKYFVYAESLGQEASHHSEKDLPKAWPQDGRIAFKSLSMRYRDSLPMVLNSVTFSTGRFEKIGIVGRTGAGKSTLTLALLRLIEPASGSITIDGIDTSTVGLYDLRSRISIVPQDPMLLEGTIRDNLDPASEYSDKEILAAIAKSCIGDLIFKPKPNNGSDNVPEYKKGSGLDTWVEPDGTNFSIGQRQLISLCRALLWQRRILVLDEATANIDSQSDRLMQTIIRKEFKDCTVLTIAHRLKTVMDSDRILVMDKGSIAEFDTPSNLMAQQGIFAELVESMQFNEKGISNK
ncbi:Canalicular multispecific organic anion transporter 2 [Coemansia brasiliensis]|uniref:Canalicular multispecific organic anion transporter 2 n=1 Tax=Coemansia brasiliensis TaxID=2650707 RepID=A0A9W8LZY4_9FUNG|nr:Canalicular multispecific organic anion transporter 2 [Coemansia brasiliensis]